MPSQTPQSTVTDTQRGWFARLWCGWIKPLAIMFVLLFSMRSAVADWNDVPSQSMEPTLLVGDRIFVNKLAYGLRVPFTMQYITHWNTPQRGEVVVFLHPEDGRRMVKRIVGIPGDRISMQRGRLIINGQMLPMETLDDDTRPQVDLTDPPPYQFANETIGSTQHTLMQLPWRARSRSFDDMRVPAGHYMVMGDNRDNSRDSRAWGFVAENRIVGRVVGVAFSLDRDDGWSPRWERIARDVD